MWTEACFTLPTGCHGVALLPTVALPSGEISIKTKSPLSHFSEITSITLLTQTFTEMLFFINWFTDIEFSVHCTDQLTSDGDLAGVGVVEDERAWLGRARREVESQGKRMLLQGLELLVRIWSNRCVVFFQYYYYKAFYINVHFSARVERQFSYNVSYIIILFLIPLQ